MSNKYTIEFDHDVLPTFDLFETFGVQKAYPTTEISMEVYDNGELICSTQVSIEGHFSCCGSYDYEIIEIETEIIKPCVGGVEAEIYEELNKNYIHIFEDTLFYSSITRIFEYLSQL